MEMPKEIVELKNDLIWTRYYVDQYKKLFLQNEKRLDLLNNTAPSFFINIERMFWNDMIISVARLMDPYEQGKNKNLSLEILIKIAKENNWSFESQISNLIEKAREKSKSVISHRMKQVAHRDLPTAMREITVNQVRINEIEEALSFAEQALNVVYSNLTNSTLNWSLISGTDVDALIDYLKMGEIYKELTEKEFDSRKDDELRRNSKYYDA